MRRLRMLVASLAIASVALTGLAGSINAARPADPVITRLTGTAQWVTDTDDGDNWYVLEVTLYAQNVKSTLHAHCVNVSFSDGTVLPGQSGGFPRVRGGATAVVQATFVDIPAAASSVTVTAQLMRIGPKGCCTPYGPVQTVTAQLPVRPAPPPAVSQPQVLFDVTFPSP